MAEELAFKKNKQLLEENKLKFTKRVHKVSNNSLCERLKRVSVFRVRKRLSNTRKDERGCSAECTGEWCCKETSAWPVCVVNLRLDLDSARKVALN